MVHFCDFELAIAFALFLGKLALKFIISPKNAYHIHTEKYSPKSYVVNFHMQMSSSQSEERMMFFTCEKNGTSNQNRKWCFSTCEKNDMSNQNSQRCVSLMPKFLPFIGTCSALALRVLCRHSTRKVFLKEIFS